MRVRILRCAEYPWLRVPFLLRLADDISIHCTLHLPWARRHRGDALPRILKSFSPTIVFLSPRSEANWGPSNLSCPRSSRKVHKPYRQPCPTRIVGPTSNRSLAKPLRPKISTLPLHTRVTLTTSSTLQNSNPCLPLLSQSLQIVQSTPTFRLISLKTRDRRHSSLRPTRSILHPMARPHSLSPVGRYSPAHKLAGTFPHPSQATASQTTLLSTQCLNSPTFTLTVLLLRRRRSLHMFIRRWSRKPHLLALQTYPQIPEGSAPSV